MGPRRAPGATVLIFAILALVMTVGALGVVTLRQPVHAALALVGTLMTLAVTYVTLEAHFLAAIQVIVYAGAIMVLFLFVIMLLNVQGRGYEERFAWLRPAAYASALVAAGAVAVMAFAAREELPDVLTVAAALRGGTAEAVGEALFGEFVLAFQLVGVLLLTGIIGAVSLVQRRSMSAPVPREAVLAAATPSAGAAAPDDLTRIRGIGPKMAALLRQNGIDSFERLASLSPAELDALSRRLHDLRGRIQRERWLEQARQLAEEKRRT